MARAAVNVEIDGLQETLKAFRGLEADMRREANGELRTAAGECAALLVGSLRGAAVSSGVPVAPRVARSIRVKSDRLPAVSIGGRARVGARGAPASALVWGSEHGGKNFGRGPGAGYWIRPTVARFKDSAALVTYRRAVFQIMRKWRLV